MPYRRRILRYGPSPDALQAEIAERAIAGCQFELHRLGGCGRGQVKLHDNFDQRHGIEPGQWIACEYETGERWYLGRIEERKATSPGGISLRLEGMSIQLNEVYPGGFGSLADGQAPHRYARSDRFPHDPDYPQETVDLVERPEDIVRLLIEQYVVPATEIKAEAGLIENAALINEVVSIKFHGEETVRSILKELAIRLQNASWGVDEWGRFFLLQQRNERLATFQEGIDLIDLTETTSRELLFNRVLLTGGYIYGGDYSGDGIQTPLRWRGNYRQPASVTTYGERRIRLWVPWIRTVEDSRQFVREFFRVYAQPVSEYAVQVAGHESCPRPWLGRVQLLDRQGNILIERQPDTVRVRFDNTPRITMVLGPDHPRTHWPEPPHDERFPVAGEAWNSEYSGPGGNISLTGGGPGSSGGSGGGGSTPDGHLSTSNSSSMDSSSLESSFLASSLDSQTSADHSSTDGSQATWDGTGRSTSWETSGFTSDEGPSSQSADSARTSSEDGSSSSVSNSDWTGSLSSDAATDDSSHPSGESLGDSDDSSASESAQSSTTGDHSGTGVLPSDDNSWPPWWPSGPGSSDSESSEEWSFELS